MSKFIVIKRYKDETPSGWEWSEEVTYHDNYDDADVEYILPSVTNTDTGKGVQDIVEKMICVPVERENK
tara:strand:- start:7699 stop:7905 length:207 start_codon:yes stop_codon:yes gene_type:complete